MLTAASSQKTVWRDRLKALRNVPPVLRLVWDAAPAVVACGLVLRVISALIPLATLAVSKWIIDLVVASLVLSLGMMMLPPTTLSLPFKILLFILADGWTLVVQSLVQSFH